MKISTFFYTIKQGFVNLFRNKWYTLASVATIAACLFLFGVFYAIIANFTHIVKDVEQGVAVTVFFVEGTTEERMEEIGKLIAGRAEVADIQFVSDEEAWADYQVDYFGDRIDEFIKGYPTNPLEGLDTYEVYLSDVSKQADLVTFIESIEGVDWVREEAGVAETLSGFNLLLSYVSMGIIGILLAVSVFLISNTVTIGISVRKEEINIMKYIGATDFFVRAPFVIEGIIIGLLGAALPMGIIYNMYSVVLEYVVSNFEMLSQLLNFLSVEELFEFLLPVSLIVGVGIGFVGSFSTVRKHLHV
ncbi:MAG: permease-like cell division protein FtsX [Lachnospiraceae bacterium]|nr:permease-like cell division protein FtsX [Lachnospiraceae bacterium]